jgi:hypothetical protein
LYEFSLLRATSQILLWLRDGGLALLIVPSTRWTNCREHAAAGVREKSNNNKENYWDREIDPNAGEESSFQQEGDQPQNGEINLNERLASSAAD